MRRAIGQKAGDDIDTPKYGSGPDCPVMRFLGHDHYHIRVSPERRTMSTLVGPQVRRSKRVVSKTPASIVVDLASHPKRIPCLIIDRSRDGFRVRLGSRLRRGQAVELITHDDPLHTIPCSVVWVGKSRSKQEGQVGLQAQLVH